MATMSRESFEELKESIKDVLSKFQEIKREIRMNAPKMFERWKAGGCAVDGDFFSMYPALEQVMEDLESEIDVEDEDQDDEGECPNYDAGVQCDCNSCTRQVAEKGEIK